MNNLNVLYEDNHIIVVEKKPNILSQSDITGDIDLLSMVKKYIKEAGENTIHLLLHIIKIFN